jgi:hypothetical protein
VIVELWAICNACIKKTTTLCSVLIWSGVLMLSSVRATFIAGVTWVTPAALPYQLCTRHIRWWCRSSFLVFSLWLWCRCIRFLLAFGCCSIANNFMSPLAGWRACPSLWSGATRFGLLSVVGRDSGPVAACLAPYMPSLCPDTPLRSVTRSGSSAELA